MKNYIDNPFVKKLLIAFAALVIFYILMNYFVMPWYVSSPELQVPKVVGMNEANAQTVLKNVGLSPVVSDTNYDEQYPKGTVIYQSPKAGNIVKQGRNIYLFISGGEQTVQAPLLRGKSILDAKFTLERLGLNLGRIDSVASSDPQNVIVTQQFEPGTQLKKGDSVNVSISVGQAIGSITVPNLIGKSLDEAEKILADSSLKVGKISFQKSFSLLPNTVLDQYPSKGIKLNPGDSVDLFVTKTDDSNFDKNNEGY